jgi:hypothetical protein
MTEYKFLGKIFIFLDQRTMSSDTRVEKFKPCAVSK